MWKRLLILSAILCAPLAATDAALGYDEHPEWRLCEIKRYDHWVLSISPAQPTLGTCVIKARRPGVCQLWELTAEEFAELGLAVRELELAMSNDPTFRPERFNTFQLCNVVHQLHFHVIPRYSGPREFAGQVWEDPGFGSLPYWRGTGLQATMVLQIRNQIEQALANVDDCSHECPCAAYVRAMQRREEQREQVAHMMQKAQEKAVADLENRAHASSTNEGEPTSTATLETPNGSA